MTVFPRQTRRASRRLAVLTCTLVVFAPASAHAASGGVAIDDSAPAQATTTTKAKASKKSRVTTRPKSVNKNRLRRAQTLLRLSATGTHDTKTRSVVRRFQRLRDLSSHGVVDLATYIEVNNAFALLETGGAAAADTPDEIAAAGATGGATTATLAEPKLALPANLAPITSTERAILDTISKCESGGNAKIVSKNGLYRGMYQFDRGTWKSVGGSGDPAQASADEQDQRAAILLRQRGTAPWPTCGR